MVAVGCCFKVSVLLLCLQYSFLLTVIALLQGVELLLEALHLLVVVLADRRQVLNIASESGCGEQGFVHRDGELARS